MTQQFEFWLSPRPFISPFPFFAGYISISISISINITEGWMDGWMCTALGSRRDADQTETSRKTLVSRSGAFIFQGSAVMASRQKREGDEKPRDEEMSSEEEGQDAKMGMGWGGTTCFLSLSHSYLSGVNATGGP